VPDARAFPSVSEAGTWPSKRDPIVVGHAAVISAGEFIKVSGSWTNDRQHGLQFRAYFLKASPTTTKERSMTDISGHDAAASFSPPSLRSTPR
jgi:hypothetical protein